MEEWITKSPRKIEGPDNAPGLLLLGMRPPLASLELERLPFPPKWERPNHRVRLARPLERSFVTEDLTNKVVAWASEVAGYAAQLPSRQARDDYLRERRRELVMGAQAEGATPGDAAIVADACVDAARRIMTELLALRAGVPKGRA